MAATEIVVLSVRQPHAHWLLHPHPTLGLKWAENRSWVSRYRGPLFIHASRWDSPPRPDADGTPPDPTVASMWNIPEGEAGPVGHILGSVDLVFSADQIDVEEAYDKLAGQSQRTLTPRQVELCQYLPDTDSPAWEWWSGDGVLVVRNPRVLVEPIPTGGKLNLWRFTVEPERLVFREQPPPTQPRTKRKQSRGRRAK